MNKNTDFLKQNLIAHRGMHNKKMEYQKIPWWLLQRLLKIRI